MGTKLFLKNSSNQFLKNSSGGFIYRELPANYQEVQYLTFSGTASAGQFIRTGITSLTHPFSVRTVYNKTNTESRDQTLVGQRQIGKYVNIYDTYYETLYGSGGANTAPDNEITSIEVRSGTGVTKNETTNLFPTSSTSSQSSSYELLIGAFSENDYTGAKWFFSGKIYSIQIINAGELFRYFIPCVRNSDGKPGLYDLVTNTFYTNAGSGEFTYGPCIDLPDTYQQVEYIQSNGTQYINTGVNMSTSNFVVNCSFLNTETTSAEQAIFSIWTSTYNYWNCFIHSSRKIDVYLASHIYGDTVSINTRYGLNLIRSSNIWTLTLNNSKVTKGYTPSTTNTTTLKLFTRGDTPSTDYSNTHIKFYTCTVHLDNILVRNFIPCYRKSDSVIGLYDIVNQQFYTNAGTGTFTKGPDIG